MSRRLVYFTVGGDPRYADLLRLAVAALLDHAPHVDILVICDEAYASHIADVPGHRHLTPPNRGGVAASMRKVEVFDWPEIQSYDTVLFLDCDVVVAASLESVFESLEREDLLHVCPEGGVDDHAAGSHSLAYSPAQLAAYAAEGVRPFNCGQFVFRVSESMRGHFAAVRELIRTWRGPYFYEQSFMNHHFGLSRATTTVPLEAATKLFAREVDAEGPVRPILHFSDTTLHWRRKLALMQLVAGTRALGAQAQEMRSFGAGLAGLGRPLGVIAESAVDAAVAEQVRSLFVKAGIAVTAKALANSPTLVVSCGPAEGMSADAPPEAWRIAVGSEFDNDPLLRWRGRQQLLAAMHVVAEGALSVRGIGRTCVATSMAAGRLIPTREWLRWMRPAEGFPCVSREAPLSEAFVALASHASRAALVLDERGRYAGYVTLESVRRHRGKRASDATPVGDLDGVVVPAVRRSDSLDDLLRTARPWLEATTWFPVVEDDGRLAGLFELDAMLSAH